MKNEADSMYKFDSTREFRQYKINKENLKIMQDAIEDFNTSPELNEQPRPFLADDQNIPKKSPLDVFGLGPPTFDGIKEHAAKFISDFIKFCNSYISFANDDDFSEAFIKCLKQEDIRKGMISFRINNPNADFEDCCVYFIRRFGTRTIAENIHYWNNFSLNFKFPNSSRDRLESIAESLHFSKYDCSTRLFSVLPPRWKNELINDNIIPTEDHDFWEEIWQYINNTLAKETLMKDFDFIVSSRFGRGRPSYSKKRLNKINSDDAIKENNEKRKGYKAYKKDNKYKRKESYKTIVYPATKLTEEDIKKEIVETIESHFTLQTTEIEEIETTNKVSFYTDELEELEEKKEIIQKKVKEIQQHCQVQEIQYTKTAIPILTSLRKKIEQNDALNVEFQDKMILPFIEALVMIDSGSNVNLISKKLANTLECNLYKVKEELSVTNGRTQIQEATTLSLILFKKPENENQKILLLHNIPFKVIPSPDYMLSLGKQMERRYRVPLNDLEEIIEIGEVSWTISNNKLEEIMESKAIAEETRRHWNDGLNQEIALPTVIEETNVTGRRSNTEITTQIFPQSTSHHSFASITSENGISFYTQPKEYQITVGNEKEIQENEENIKKLLPKELMEFKDVFDIPKGLPPSRGKWDFKLNISKEDMEKLPIAKPKSIGKEAEAATKEMLAQYLKDG